MRRIEKPSLFNACVGFRFHFAHFCGNRTVRIGLIRGRTRSPR
ncbi:hypothetical protein ACVW17_007191 [Bradyrhizobium sp. USDA 4473]